jgi:phage/plasmid primase-like uncharacterized protein
MIAAEIAAALGGAKRSAAWWRCRCPVHGSRGPTLALRDHPRGLAVKCFAGCTRDEIVAELRRRGLVSGEASERDRRPDPAEHARRNEREAHERVHRIEAARSIWNAARNPRGTPVADYFVGRGMPTRPPASLRYAPALRCLDGNRGPAMVARIDGPEGELIGVHRTWLYRDAAGKWRRGNRRMLGRAAGGAVRLASAAETLLIGEGLETCLSAMQATEMPAWAALSTSGLVALVLPPIVKNVVILTDNDVNGAGEWAARKAAQCWLAEGRRVRIALPPEPGTDMADLLAGRLYAEMCDAAA